MIGVEVDVGVIHAVALAEGLALAGDQIGHGHHFHIREFHILLNVRFRDPAGADDADAQLFAGVHFFLFRALGKLAQDGVAIICHNRLPPSFLRGAGPRLNLNIVIIA